MAAAGWTRGIFRMAEPQSHEWSAPQTREQLAYTPQRPRSIGRLFWWYLARSLALLSILAVLGRELDHAIWVLGHYVDWYGPFGPLNIGVLARKFTNLLPLVVALIFFFMSARTLRVLGYGASAVCGCLVTYQLYRLIQDHCPAGPVLTALLVLIDLPAAPLTVYSALYLTADYLARLRRTKAVEIRMVEAQAVEQLRGEELRAVDGSIASAGITRQRKWLRGLAVAPLPLVLVWADWIWFHAEYGEFGRRGLEYFLGFSLGMLLAVGAFLPSKTVRLSALSAGVFVMMMPILTVVQVYAFQLQGVRRLLWKFRWEYEGLYIVMMAVAIAAVVILVKQIRREIALYEPEKMFLPAGEAVDDLGGMGKWDEGSGRKG